MDRMTTHAAALAKTRAMRRGLLGKETFQALMEAPSLSAAFDVLAGESLFKDWKLDINEPDPIQATEAYLAETFENQIAKLYHYYGLAYKHFLGLMIARFDLETLKMVLRILEDQDETIIPKPQVRLAAGRHVSERIFDPELLAKATDKRSVADAIRWPAYRALVEAYNPGKPLAQFDLEMRMDRQYFQELVSAAKRLGSSDQKQVLQLIGENIDLQNLRWIFRAKRFYDLSNELVFTYTLPEGRIFNTDKLYKLCESSPEGVRDLIAETPYRFILEQPDEAMPSLLPKHLMQRCHSLAKKDPMSLAPIMAFLHDWEFMLLDLMTVLEAKAYNVDPRPYLIQKGL